MLPLYGRVPAGVGTPLVESLTGFVSRLAVARHLGVWSIFKRLVCPLIPGEMLEGERGASYWRQGFFGPLAGSWNGHGKHVEALVDALAELTGLEHLSWHTLLPLKGLLPAEKGGAISELLWKRWCARCVAGWRRKNIELWEPLLWRVSFVKRCPIHGNLLSDVCGTCKKPQGLVSDRVPFGRCFACKGHLEVDDPLVLTRGRPVPLAGMWDWELSRAVGKLLASQDVLEAFASGRGFVQLLNGLRDHPKLGSSHSVARYVGSTRQSVEKWRKGDKRPGLATFLKICIRVGADPVAVTIYPHGESLQVEGELPFGIQPEKKRHRMREAPARNWGAAEWDKIKRELRGLLESGEAGLHSASSVAVRLGVAASTLKKHCPEEYEALKLARIAWRLSERERRFAEWEAVLRTAYVECLREGLHPSMQRVLERAGFPKAWHMQEEFRRLFRKIRRSNGLI